MTREFVTLPREVVEQALEAFDVATTPLARDRQEVLRAQAALRAALKQPQNYALDAGNMVQAGWKLVPVEPNCSMVLAGERSLEQHDFLRLDSAYRAMLAAAPHPPALDQPQAEQPAMTPIAQRKLDSLLAEGYTISGYSVYHEQKHRHGFVTGVGLVGWWKPEGVEYPQPLGEQEPVAWMVTSEMQDGTRSTYPMIGRFKDVQDCCDFGEPVPLIYQHPQPKRNPLTDEQIDAIADAMPGGLEGFMKGWGWRKFARAVIEATNNIK